MKKIRFDDCICHDKIRDHDKIKEEILWHIDKSSDGPLIDTYGVPEAKSNITKLDWDKSTDFKRPWVQIFLPVFEKTLEGIIDSMGYKSVDITRCWYQQYLNGSSHCWHIHDQHFTGVYYLEYPKGSAKTEVISPYSMKIKKINAKEGDLIVFPSHWIHRSGVNSSFRKTIISYNFGLNPNSYSYSADHIKGGKPYILF